MHSRQIIPSQVVELLRAQYGVISVEQLRAHGLTSRVLDRLTAGWRRLTRGIYLTQTASWESAVWAGILRAGTGATIGGLAACYLEGAVRDAPSTLMVWAQETKAPFLVGAVRVEFIRGCPSGYRLPSRTRIHPSLLDVARTHDALDTAATITSAFSRRIADPQRLLAEMETRSRQRHRELIATLCDPSTRGVHSLIEWLFLRDVIRKHGLPSPNLQIRKSAGRVDAHYPDFHTIVELDGMRDHGDWSKDMFRDNAHLLDDGSHTLRYGLNAVMNDPCGVSTQVATRLHQQGWNGAPRACPQCYLEHSVDLTTDIGG